MWGAASSRRRRESRRRARGAAARRGGGAHVGRRRAQRIPLRLPRRHQAGANVQEAAVTVPIDVLHRLDEPVVHVPASGAVQHRCSLRQPPPAARARLSLLQLPWRTPQVGRPPGCGAEEGCAKEQQQRGVQRAAAASDSARPALASWVARANTRLRPGHSRGTPQQRPQAPLTRTCPTWCRQTRRFLESSSKGRIEKQKKMLATPKTPSVRFILDPTLATPSRRSDEWAVGGWALGGLPPSLAGCRCRTHRVCRVPRGRARPSYIYSLQRRHARDLLI